MNTAPLEEGQIGVADDPLLGTEPGGAAPVTEEPRVLPIIEGEELWEATLKLLKLLPNKVPPQPKPSGGHIPGVGQAVTISVVKIVVVPTEPET